jgi:PhzF family phenazine biosynthesis protein
MLGDQRKDESAFVMGCSSLAKERQEAKMSLTIYQADAFTDRPFAGNPAAVCVLPEPREAAWMQAVALEMNLSETAFLLPHEEGYDLRWFTPAVEVDLCGHATLASAHILWETGLLAAEDEARFSTRSGLLTARKTGDMIELNFPAVPAAPMDSPAGLLEALGVTPRWVGKNRMDYLVEVATEAEVRGLTPDFARLSTLGVRGVMVTARASSPGFDFVSRFFAPGSGINEDPVTGSAHCCLGPYWQGVLGKSEFVAFQASPRGGVVRVGVDGERVRLGGQAVTVLRAELLTD